MKRVLLVVALFLLTVLSSEISGNKGISGNTGINAVQFQQVVSIPTNQDPADIEDEDDVWIDQEFFPRKLFQKNLDQMSEKEKISWSFRMAKTYPFL